MKYPPQLKAISIHAPHAYAICMGLKDAEYRTQPTKRRGWVLIHSSQSKDSDEFFAQYGISPSQCRRGAIIGAAKITGCTGYPGDWAYHLASPILFEHPIEGVKGKQSVFWGATTEDLQIPFTLASQQIAKILNSKI